MKKYFYWFLGAFFAIWFLLMGMVAVIDPFFHYHAPLDGLYYSIGNQRYQNRGMAEQFDYDSIITGTSLTENFMTSEFDSLFDAKTVRLQFSGATFYETEQLLEEAFKTHDNIKYVMRSLDVNHLVEDSDALREDLGDYPYYLYNDSVFDDLPYLCNEDVMFGYCIPMIKDFLLGKEGGCQSFDELTYNSLPAKWEYADEPVIRTGEAEVSFTDKDMSVLSENVSQNIVKLANEHPDTTFIYYIPPYNEFWWRGHVSDNTFEYTCTTIEKTIEMMLECDNIKLYCYANRFDITTNLDDYYVDGYHYIKDINSEILKWIANDEDRVTVDNYKDYVKEMHDFYGSYKYYSMGYNER
ncbi:hypothetical protein [Butyrivibrio sp. NC2007]|uniref:hypothetical protein n=1 Tax=Butyrivibrio sp. NC2007 TaxID=1280683 RepID=UPI0003B38B6E|nr:hypothetical protein [Butyrivibrio sp. NC2007]